VKGATGPFAHSKLAFCSTLVANGATKYIKLNFDTLKIVFAFPPPHLYISWVGGLETNNTGSVVSLQFSTFQTAIVIVTLSTCHIRI